MKFNAEELKKFLGDDGLKLAEDMLEMAAKKLGELSMESIAKIVNDSSTKWDDVIWAAAEDRLEDLVSKIEVHL